MPPTKKTLKADAMAFLKEHLPGAEEVELSKRLAAIQGKPKRTSTRDAKVREVACAYALSLAYEDDEALHKRLTSGEVSRGAKADLDRAFVDARTNVADVTQRRAQQRQSRNVRALRYLKRLKIKPSTVVQLSQGVGEGILAWADRATESAQVRSIATVQQWAVVSFVDEGEGEIRQFDVAGADGLRELRQLVRRRSTPMK